MAALAATLGGHGVLVKTAHPQAAPAVSSKLPKSAFVGKEFLCKIKETNLRVTRRPQVAVFASATEPKWKQKLAAADEHQEKTRQATAQAQEEYRRKQDALRRQSAEAGGGAASSLKNLEYVPYLTEDGHIADCTQPGVKASVYAIFDKNKTLCYIGVSRQVFQSMRLHFARRPLQCHYVKVMHVMRPSRALLEGTRDIWISENGSVPEGNDNGEVQNLWENALDCAPLMTEEEKLIMEEAAPGPPTAKALKNVARRIEKELEKVFKQRQCTDTLRFDPKLKDRGLLDLKGIAVQPDTAVPKSTPKPT